MKTKIFAIATATALLASTAVAQDFSAPLKARQGQFRIIALNLGILGGMAQGKIAYDADAAQRAADSLAAVSQIDPAPLWPEDSDNEMTEGTRALPAIWTDHDGFLDKWATFGTAAAGMQSVAANGQEALGPAMGPLGASCKGCHATYRAK
ncbi:c-type cytochrome [Pseudodonghicola flavimaris]|uniref:Cytochrome c n=1 Tax=Pseudodonghicola flavimaris TaxID=3050036 RepID=A0ABT7EV95_9RHOB|nr:cytochrome c [Pseudodonghicola flavimaris]MDK3016264.1 cytochrome c [Pseudodonghicola flavimaris]